MIHVTVEPPITKDDGMELKGIYFISSFEIEYRKSHTIKGIQYASLNVQLSAHISTKNILKASAKATCFPFSYLSVLWLVQHCLTTAAALPRLN
jgi:hypothetical protein